MEELLVDIKVTRICRLCLSGDGTLIDMFSFSSELESLIVDAVIKCTSVHIKKHSELPTAICESCYVQLIKTHQFQMQALQSEKTLQVYLQRLRHEDKRNILESSVLLSNIDGNSCVETNIAIQENNEFDTNCEEIKPCIKNSVSDCEVPEMDIEETKVFTVDLKPHTEGVVHSSIKDAIFDPNLIIKPEPVENDRDVFGTDTDFTLNQKVIKSENEVPNDKTTSSYHCDVCNLYFMNSDILRKHQCSYTVQKLYQCDICNKCFSNPGILRKHRCIHTGEKPYQCDVCNKSFHRLDHFRNHQRVHTGEKPYRCDDCAKSFSNAANLKRHQRAHTGEKPYQCDVCIRCFSNSDNLERHKRGHTGEKPFECDFCKKLFSKSSALAIHRRAHTGVKPYRCDRCDKCFTISANLSKHQRLHTGEKPFRCDVCNKSFSQQVILNRHQRLHTGEKPYQCDLCNKCFTISANLSKHQRVHTGEKPYRCDVCHKCFSYSANLRRHQSVHTREEL